MKFKPSRLVAAVALTTVTAAGQATFGPLAAQGDLAFSHGKFADAEKAYVEALKQPRETPQATSREAAILNSLAIIYSLKGRYAESESLCLRALAIVDTTSGKTDTVLASILSALGSVNLHLGKYSKAEQYIQWAIALRKHDARDQHTGLLADYTLLGVALCSQGKCRQAEQVIQQALPLCEFGSIDCQNGSAAARATLAAIYARRGRYREAEEWYNEALEILEAAFGPSNSMLVPVLSDLSSLYASRNRFSEAEVTGRRALEIAAKDLLDSDAAAKAALATGQALAGQHRFEAAAPFFKQSLAIHERAQGPESIQYAWALQLYGRFLRKAKRPSEASVIETRANAMLKQAGQKVDVSEFPKH
jgi:tetratricopeptide (TPR) repeat protein